MGTRLLPLLLLALAPACGSPATPPERGPAGAPVTVQLDTVRLEDVAEVTEATGSVAPWARVSPGTKIMGRIETVSVRAGDRVHQGQPLARLEQADRLAAVEQARAALAMAEARATNAAAQHRRMEALHGRGSVTDKALEDALAAARVAEAAVAQARANVTAAEVTLDYAEIRSPLDGVVTRKLAEAGDMAQPGTVLFTIEDLSRVKVVVTVPESAVVGLEEGAPARVTVDALGRTWETEVDRVIPSGDVQSRTFDVQFVLSNPDGDLKSGMFARAAFDRGTQQALLVPPTAIVERGQLRGLFVVDDGGHARLRWIRLGRDRNGRREVLSGLVEGERFVVIPPAGLVDGALVREG